jgi:hypothetical protein
MGSGNTKNGLRDDEKIEVDTKNETKTKSMEHPWQRKDTDIDVNNSKVGKEKSKNNTQKPNGSILKETKRNEEKDSLDSNAEESQSVEDTKLKLAERGFTDSTLITHCVKTPTYLEIFISVYEAMKLFEEKVGGEDFLDAQRQANVFSSSYSKAKKKITLGNFLADIGFARVVKEIYLKLEAAFPNLLTYDRELDEELKKYQDKEKRDEDESETTDLDNNTNTVVKPTAEVKPAESSVQPTESSVQPAVSSVNNYKPEGTKPVEEVIKFYINHYQHYIYIYLFI